MRAMIRFTTRLNAVLHFAEQNLIGLVVLAGKGVLQCMQFIATAKGWPR
jgi:hypothetical protein